MNKIVVVKNVQCACNKISNLRCLIYLIPAAQVEVFLLVLPFEV